MSPINPSACPLCLSENWQSFPDGTWLCRACQLHGNDTVQLEQPMPKALLNIFSNQHLKLNNPFGLIAKIRRLAEKDFVEGYCFPPTTAMMLIDALRRKTNNIMAFKPLGRLNWATRYTIESSEDRCNPPTQLPNLTIGGLCQIKDLDTVADIIISCLAVTQSFAFVIDDDKQEVADTFGLELHSALAKHLSADEIPAVKLAAHPLNRNFAAQRNHLQQLASTEWVLQLDTDERLSEHMHAGLSAAIHRATIAGLDSIGFARANYVDGALTAFWPDVQFRLNRKSVRFVGRVHEAPSLPWQRQSWCLLGHINHFMASARLPVRQQQYESITEGGGRPGDRSLLETAFNRWKTDDPLAPFRPAAKADVPEGL